MNCSYKPQFSWPFSRLERQKNSLSWTRSKIVERNYAYWRFSKRCVTVAISIIHKNIIESQIRYTIVLFTDYVGVGLKHQYGDVKTEPSWCTSEPLRPGDGQQQSFIFVSAQRGQYDQQQLHPQQQQPRQRHPQSRSPPYVSRCSESEIEDRRASYDSTATVASSTGATNATECSNDAYFVETHHCVVVRELRKLFVHIECARLIALCVNLKDRV